jgi:hypothetical protein
VNTLTLEAHLRLLYPDKRAFLQGTQETFWTRYERWSMLRVPVFALNTPTQAEVRQALRRALVVSYPELPSATKPANTVVYLCRDHAYALEKLSAAMRRNVRRGAARLAIQPLSTERVLQQGYSAYADTRQRVGLSDADRRSFERRFMERARSPANVYLGAWLGERLIAFLSITEVADWVEFESLFSCTDALEYRPNDTLLYHALRYYLVESPRALVSYGIRSVQSQAEEGLHQFKLKVGFEAQAVHRAFVLHPALRPFVNGLSHSLLRRLLKHFPKNRPLRKAEGLISTLSDTILPPQER